jgi:biopolymer transport protein ExbD
MRRNRREAATEASGEFDVSPLMNLMIVLVPVLMLSMTLTYTRVIELDLPWSDSARGSADPAAVQLEVRVDADGKGTVIRDIPRAGRGHDFATLALVMQNLKRELPNERDVLLLLTPDVNYQTVVSAMDSIRGYRTRVGDKDVTIELFPVISLGDVPPASDGGLPAAGADNGLAAAGDARGDRS